MLGTHQGGAVTEGSANAFAIELGLLRAEGVSLNQLCLSKLVAQLRAVI
jgi:hypothetical protein